MDNLKYLDGDEISKSFDSIFKSINFTSKDEIIAFELIVSYLHYKFKKTRNTLIFIKFVFYTKGDSKEIIQTY